MFKADINNNTNCLEQVSKVCEAFFIVVFNILKENQLCDFEIHANL